MSGYTSGNPINWWQTHWRQWSDLHAGQSALAHEEPFLGLEPDEQEFFCLLASEMLA